MDSLLFWYKYHAKLSRFTVKEGESALVGNYKTKAMVVTVVAGFASQQVVADVEDVSSSIADTVLEGAKVDVGADVSVQ